MNFKTNIKPLLICLFFGVQLLAQNPHPYFRNFTTDNGLPSSEVHYCLKGPDGYMWFATDNGLSRFDGYTFKNYGLREGLKDPVVLYMQLDSKGCIWLLTLSGDLYFMPQNQLLGQKDSIHAFVGNEAIRQVPKEFFPDDFLIGENDEMYISFPRSGIMILKPDGSHQLVQAKNPFGTVFLYQTSVRWMRGYSKCPDELTDDYMATYGTKGQPPYEVHAKREPSKNISVAPPFFESIALNGQLLTQATPVFGYYENNLAFHYLTLNYDQAGSIPYRYRLNDGAWYLTKDRIANFANLASGSYRFEVQSQNEDGIWSKSLIYPFSILSPWWLRWWFFGLLALTALAVGFFIYRKQTSILKKELAFKEQVLELEKKALQAQMNPHFIFNCLNSIQKLILDKDAAQAMRYLSRFGKLVRSTLNASLAGEVTLQEEVEMLENYLEMEKLRFKEVFNYQLTVHPSLDVFDIAFPPILLQPYVENAIIHGMKAKGGKVAIDFHPLGKQIVVTITDNGPGIRQSAKQPLDHKSVGMTLTQRRLELLHNSPDKEGLVQVFEIKDEKGEVLGTKVQVRLR